MPRSHDATPVATPGARTPRRASGAWVPTLRGYRRGWLRGDVLAGLAAGTVVVPQAMAYATIAGLPVEVGLYTCMLPLVGYALLGGGRALSVSTTSTIAVLVAATLAGLTGRSDGELLRAAFTLTALVGVCLLGMRLLRLGSLIENISPATLAGIRVGVGLTVAASQLPALLGVGSDEDATGFFARVLNAASRVPEADPATVTVSVVTVALLLLLHRVAPVVPGPLVAVAGGILLVATTPVEDHGLALIDRVPTGLPSLTLPVPADLFELLPGGLAIAVMAFMETVLVARTNRRPGEPPIDTDQELLANGVAAIAGGLSQSLPPAGGFSQSAVNLRAGARSQVSGLTTAALALLVALFLAPLLADLPRAVLAAMVLVAIVGLLDPSDFARFARIDRAELWVALVVAGLSLTGGMLLGVAAGIALTLVLVVRSVNQPRVRRLFARHGGGWTTDPAAAATAEDLEGVLLLHLDGALYTGNAQSTVDAVLALTDESDPPARAVVLDGSDVRAVTVPMLDAFRALEDALAQRSSILVLAELPVATTTLFAKSRWFTDLEDEGRVRATIEDAVRRAAQGR